MGLLQHMQAPVAKARIIEILRSAFHGKEGLSLYRLRPESRRDIPRLTGACFTALRR